MITEGREGGTAGIFRPSGEMRTGPRRRDRRTRSTSHDLIFEAPTKSSQAWFIKHFGPNVNLGNIPPDEVIPLETLRLGLRGDTLKEVLLGGEPARSFLSSTTSRWPRRRSCACCSTTFPGRVSLACSFQKEESVLLDMLFAIDPDARVFALDTHVLFPETYAVWREVERRYGTTVEVYEGPTLARQAELHGEALWERKPDLCCAIRKVEPLEPRARRARRLDHRPAPRPVADARGRAEGRLGRRRTSSGRQTRSPTGTTHAASPTSRERGLPYNELHDRGYASIGCTHCTQPGAGREGRWAGCDKSECGLHTLAGGCAA